MGLQVEKGSQCPLSKKCACCQCSSVSTSLSHDLKFGSWRYGCITNTHDPNNFNWPCHRSWVMLNNQATPPPLLLSLSLFFWVRAKSKVMARRKKNWTHFFYTPVPFHPHSSYHRPKSYNHNIITIHISLLQLSSLLCTVDSPPVSPHYRHHPHQSSLTLSTDHGQGRRWWCSGWRCPRPISDHWRR